MIQAQTPGKAIRFNPRLPANLDDRGLTRVIGGSTETYAYDNGDKLNSVTTASSTKSYTYDSAGRTTSVTTSAGTTSLSYDYEDRIVQISYPGGGTNTFTYNGLDTRVGKTDSSGTKSYRRDGVDVTSPVLNDSSASYTPGISSRQAGSTSFMSWSLQTIDQQTSASQAVTTSRAYDAFGNCLSQSGAWSGNCGYNGLWFYQEDGDSQLKLLGYRYYDSSIGRFLTRDMARDGRNWYSYCSNCPLGRADPVGLSWGAVIGGFVGGLVVGSIIVATGGVPILLGAGLGAIWVGSGAAIGGYFDHHNGEQMTDDFKDGARSGALLGLLPPTPFSDLGEGLKRAYEELSWPFLRAIMQARPK